MDKAGAYVTLALSKGGIHWAAAVPLHQVVGLEEVGLEVAAAVVLHKEVGLQLPTAVIVHKEVGHQLVMAEVGLEVVQMPTWGELAEIGMEVAQMPARGELSEVGMEVAKMPARVELAEVGMEFQVAPAIKISPEVGGLKVAQACIVGQEDQEHQQSQEDLLKVIQAFVLIHQLARHIISNHRIIVASALWLALAEHL